MTDDGDAGVHQQPDGSWIWWARWLGGVEQSGHTFPGREDAVRALREVLDDSTNA
ncbi:hypothetical protein ATJ97_0295 [Georgenia soli]|uniref:DUF1508 domain-containing protein n=1 Tax=Georgenia soli TaxID=638953 RepID=A0A2A9F135_9MICO|nr:hypothetical protein [Georgenia soli]PFG44873.1 hypothetical protein ATJ97_0146 [Georgenia soli]PFG45014.1 hypothetical protein ATJ97_0295 [Georgenia soli]